MITFIKYLLIFAILLIFSAILIMETRPGREIGRWVFGLSFQQLEQDWRQLQGKSRPDPVADPATLEQRLTDKGVEAGNPVFIRTFKVENKLELWLKKQGRFVLFETYPVCAWSGQLGPKLKEGDRQAPEGFYPVSQGQLNPNSKYYRSFNLGYPNTYDRSHSRTGSYLMIHGDCKSIGCYAMTDPVIGEIWHLVTKAFANGQRSFQVQALPFHLTNANLTRYTGHKWQDFWKELKPGYDMFNETGLPPGVTVSNKHYQFSRQEQKEQSPE